MSFRLSRPFGYLLRRPATVEAEIDEELRTHLAMRVEELTAQGLTEGEARAEALRQFGDLDATRRYCRRQDEEKERRVARALALGDLLQDLKIAARGLSRAPGLAAVIVATVGLGIGATTVTFSAVYAALQRPLPYADPERLVRIYTDAPPNRFRFSVADYLALTAEQTRFESVAGYTERAMSWSDGAVAERVRGRVVTWTYFDLLGLRPALGRGFNEAEGRPGGAPAVVVSHGFWQRRLGGRADAVGGSIRLDGADYTVVGVLPPDVGPLEQGQEFFAAAQWDLPRRKGPFFIITLGRLKSAADRFAADEELRAINRRLFPVWKASYQDEKATWSTMDLKTHVVGDVGTAAGLALGAVGLVWLIACANASSLLVARVTSRRRELAVRTALGATRARVMRHLLAESAVLAAAAALLGGGLAWAGVRALGTLAAGYVPRVHEAGFDGPVAWTLLGLTAASVLLFGLIPALHGSAVPVDETLRSLGRTATASVAVRRLRRFLVATQFAIATPLLVAACLLLASLDALGRVDVGFDTRNLVSGAISLPPSQYADTAQVAGFWEELQRRLQGAPGVAAVAFADGRPPVDVGNFNNFDLEDAPTPPGQSQPVTPWVAVTPEYFRLLGLSLIEGRLLDERDGTVTGRDVVVVDRAWARRFFPGGSAIGRRLKGGGCSECPWTTVVGVVSEVKYAGLDKPDEGSVYTPLVSRPPEGVEPVRFRYVIVRTSVDPPVLLAAVREAVRGIDPTVPLAAPATMDELIARSLQRPRTFSLLVAGFAAAALLLSLVGIYGVMAYYVQQHSKDISIRLALGGRPRDVLGLVVGQAMRVVASGVALGLVAAFAVARLMASLLFGVSANDAATMAAVGAALVVAALAACFVPARRALGVPPAALLRAE